MPQLIQKDSKPILAGVLGFPVDHSLSPDIFTWISKRRKTDLTYCRLSIPPDRFEVAFPVLKDLGIFLGWNVTLPYKQSIIPHLDRLTPDAQLIGAVNVVQKTGNGQFVGHNTDVFGIRKTFEEQKFNLKGKEVLLIGAGGAALAVGTVLGTEHAKQVRIINRTRSKAQDIVKKLSERFPKTRFESIPWKSSASRYLGTQLFINATPLGMKGCASIDFDRFFPQSIESKSALAFDLIYRPEKTPFNQAADQRGIKTVGGLDMLIWQALGTWTIWIEKLTNTQQNQMKKELKAFLRKKIP